MSCKGCKCTGLSKLDVMDNRHSETIDVSKSPDLYFAKLAWESYGNSIRDNTLREWIVMGQAIERGQDGTT